MRPGALARALGENRIVGDLNADRLGNVVKSAGRALNIIELFDVLHREATVSEVAELLDFPQSSTSGLLHSMVELGYLAYNGQARTFAPTLKIALLGNWVARPLVSDGELMRLMRRLSATTGHAATLSMRNGVFAEHIHVVPPPQGRPPLMSGSKSPLIGSGAGLVMLADLADPDIRRVTIRINSEAQAPDAVCSHVAVLKRVEEVRAQGYGHAPEACAPGFAIIAMVLSADNRGEKMVIGVAGDAAALHEDRDAILAAMRTEITGLNRAPAL